MNRIYNILIILILLLTGMTQAPAQAQDVFSYPLGPQTTDAFITTCSRLAEHPIIRGNFEQEKIIKRLNRSLKSSGNFIIAVDQGMVWDTVKPFPSTLTLGRDYLIQSRGGRQKTMVNAQGNEIFLRMAEVLSMIFSGNAQGLLAHFSVFFSGNANGDAWELGLSPIDKTIHSFAEKIIIKGDTVIRSIQIYEQNGDSVQYILSNHRYPIELTVNEKALFAY
jgi:hypothetical protein